MSDDQQRSRRIDVRVFRTLAEHDQADAQFWTAMSVGTRVRQVWALSEAQWRLRDEFPDASGLPRSVARVRRA